MGYRKRKLEIIKKFLDLNLLIDINRIFSKSFTNSEEDKIIEHNFGEKLRFLFEDLGPVFIKFGQLLSTRRDIFSENIISELEKLQDEVKEEEYDHIREVIEGDFGKKIDDIYDEFDKKPLATGSIAQTHIAFLTIGSTRKKVLVKVRKKDIEKRVKEDLEIMIDLYKKLEERLQSIKPFNLGEIIEEFKISLNKEIDFTLEKENIKKYKALNTNPKDLKAPDVYDLYCRDRVITMQYIDGKSIRSIYNKDSITRRKIGEDIIKAYVNQIFSYGYFHADPHPGNIFVDRNLDIYLLDFGIVASLSENYRYQIMKIFLGASFNEVKMITDSVIGMGLLEFDRKKIPEFEKRVQKLLDTYMVISINQMKLADLIKDFYLLLEDYSIKIPSELTNFAKTIFTLEGLIEKLVYNESFIELALPIARSMVFKLLKPNIVLNRIRPKAYDIYSLIKEFPQSSLNILRQLENGDFRLISQKSLEEKESYEKTENKKSDAIVFLGISIIFAISLIGLIILGYRGELMKTFLVLILSLSFVIGLGLLENIIKK